jgi:hypothetical protein
MNALEELRQRDQWVCWRTIEREGKPTKVPYQPNGHEARSNDPATWSSYATVTAAADRFDGIGYVFSAEDPYTGIDIDRALVDGTLHPGAIEVVQALRSYTEWSPSGVGVHVLVRAHKPDHSRSTTRKTPWGDELAVYDRLRYFAITGRRLPTLPDAIEPRQDEIEALLAHFMPSGNGTGARGAKNGDRRVNVDPEAVKRALHEHPGLETLVERTGPDPSADDYALAAAAARDGLGTDLVEQILLYRLERHGDPKGKAHRRDYVPTTVKKAVADAGRERRDEQLGDPLVEASEIIEMQEVPLIAAEEQRGGRVVLERQDGLELHVPTLETLAKFDRLCAALGAQFGHRLIVARDRKTSTAIGFVSALRRYFGPGHVRALEERIESWFIDLVQSVGAEVTFEAGDAQSRLVAWQALNEIDPADGGMSATGYARKVKLAHDTTTGDRYLRASWVQEYLRRCGWRGTPEQTAGLLETIGLEQPNPRSDGRVRARWRGGNETLVLRFWVISAPDYERWRA